MERTGLSLMSRNFNAGHAARKPGSYSSECPKQAAPVGAVKMAFAIGILILVIAATTIIGATWLALIASGDMLR
jgi:hypothetical protein